MRNLVRRIVLVFIAALLAGAAYAAVSPDLRSLALSLPRLAHTRLFPGPHRLGPSVQVEKVVVDHDQDGDGIPDLDDIVQGAREYVAGGVRYKDGYHAGGYPPEGEGVCTDVIWAALRAAGYDLKAMVDEDIRQRTSDYPRVAGKPDPNIDFRRVVNLRVFFRKYGASLTTEVKPGDPDNLKEWQGGDIVIYGAPLQHIGIVSDKRRKDGVPLLIHNGGPRATEDDQLLSWPSRITDHIRFTGTGK